MRWHYRLPIILSISLRNFTSLPQHPPPQNPSYRPTITHHLPTLLLPAPLTPTNLLSGLLPPITLRQRPNPRPPHPPAPTRRLKPQPINIIIPPDIRKYQFVRRIITQINHGVVDFDYAHCVWGEVVLPPDGGEAAVADVVFPESGRDLARTAGDGDFVGGPPVAFG